MTDTVSVPADPFLPDGRQWVWSSSTLGLAKECKRKYYYAQILGYRGVGANPHLIFGAHYAKALERYHRYRATDNQDHQTCIRAVVDELLVDTLEWHSEHHFKNRDTLLRSVVWYLEEFKDDPCETIVLADGKPAVELTFTFQVTDDIWLAGHLDRLVRYAGDCYVQDQKTTGSTLGAYYFNRYNPDNQVSLYSIAADVIYKTPVAGVMIDAAQIAVGFTRFARGLIPRTKDQQTEWLADAVYHIKETWRAAEAGYPMNDKACQLYGGCEFLEVCSKSPRVREDYLRGGFEQRGPINPLEIR
jgi:hypothetical protein